MKIDIKPLSVNECWKGQRFKTQKYKTYENELLSLLPNLKIPKGKLEVNYVFGFSSKLSDWDNPIKPFQDILQKRYLFDDRDIFKATVEKVLVKKGSEFVSFEIKELYNSEFERLSNLF